MSYCIAQGTIFNILLNHNGKEYANECIYVYNQVTMLYSRDSHNIVNQRYFNLKKKTTPQFERTL